MFSNKLKKKFHSVTVYVFIVDILFDHTFFKFITIHRCGYNLHVRSICVSITSITVMYLHVISEEFIFEKLLLTQIAREPFLFQAVCSTMSSQIRRMSITLWTKWACVWTAKQILGILWNSVMPLYALPFSSVNTTMTVQTRYVSKRFRTFIALERSMQLEWNE